MWIIDDLIKTLESVGTHLDTERQMMNNLIYAKKQLNLEMEKLPTPPKTKKKLEFDDV